MKDPASVAKRWGSNLASATQAIQEGVQSVSVAPGQAAARQKGVWLSNVQASADKWARNTASVSLEEWKAAFINKGINRIASGAEAAEPKFAQFMGRLLPFIDTLSRNLPARGNLEANIARMTQFVRGMTKFQNT